MYLSETMKKESLLGFIPQGVAIARAVISASVTKEFWTLSGGSAASELSISDPMSLRKAHRSIIVTEVVS